MLSIYAWKQFDNDQNQFNDNFAGHFVLPLSDCKQKST